jgi:hypothetical protein
VLICSDFDNYEEAAISIEEVKKLGCKVEQGKIVGGESIAILISS